jgi:hypothetical protein
MADAGGPVVVLVVAVITNAVSELDLNLGVTGNGAYVVVIRDVLQCAVVCVQQEPGEQVPQKQTKHMNRFLKSKPSHMAMWDQCAGHV